MTRTRGQGRVPPGPHSAPATPGYTVLDVFLRWQVTPALDLQLGVDNLTDQTYRRHLTRINDRGRTWKLGAGYRF